MNPPEPGARLTTRSAAGGVFDLLRHEILINVLKPLEVIREAAIAERLGVSRTPVREALLRLADLGLVEIFPQSGTRVAPIRIGRARAAQLIREAVEVEIVRRACRDADEEALLALSAGIEDQDAAARRGDLRRLFELDEAFHRAIFEAAGFPAVADELEDVKIHLNRLRFLAVDWPRPPGFIVNEHRAIAAALMARDEGTAAQAMTAHLRAVLVALDAIGRGETPNGAGARAFAAGKAGDRRPYLASGVV